MYWENVMHTAADKVEIEFSNVDLVANMLKVLANPDRLKILCKLVEHELSVQQIEACTEIHQPTLSQQLTVLRNNDIVMTRRDGKQIFYQLSDPKIITLMQTLYQLYCQN